MEIGRQRTTQTSEITQNHADEIQVCASLLRQTWACVGNQKSPSEMRSQLETLASRDSPRGNKALEVFNALAARVANMASEPVPEWLRIALEGRSPEHLSVQLVPTAIVLSIPDQLFSEISPQSSGVTLSYSTLPEELRGRIILMPHPPRQGV